jgi:hypothetical protein
MSDKEFALITVLVSSVFGLIVAVATSKLSSSSENKVFRRQLRRDKVDATRLLYEDALFVLNRTVSRLGVGDNTEQTEINRMLARLALSSTNDIRNQYEKTAEAVDTWAATYRKSQPERHGDNAIVKSGMGKYREEADLLIPNLEENLSKLRKLMIEHIGNLEAEIK